MADSNKAKNATFLQQLERQRLLKDCRRPIDLRGKVVGECHAYDIAGLTHFLDDRGYLLVKQLMSRFENRYTIGVYETVFKAVRILKNQPQETTTKLKPAVLTCDENHVQLISLGNQLQRKESRIVYSTNVELRFGEMLFQGTTLDIASEAIRISLKRIYTLEQGDVVLVSLPELSPLDSKLLTNNPYQVTKVEHDERRSQLVLSLTEQASIEFVQWLKSWLEKQHQRLKFDVDHQLMNIVSQLYLRLYNAVSQQAFLWLTLPLQADSIAAIHFNKLAERTIKPLFNDNGKLELSRLPVWQVCHTPSSRYLAFIYSEEDSKRSVFCNCNDAYKLAQILNLHQVKSGHLFLLQNHLLSDRENVIETTDTADLPASLLQQFSTVDTLVTVTDISESSRNLAQFKDVAAIESISIESNEKHPLHLPPPTTLTNHIARKTPRFIIKTDIETDVFGQRYKVITNDVSEFGMSISLPGHVTVSEGSILRINFIRWQGQTKKVKLDRVPYTVQSMQYWEGITTLGLERNTYACGDKLNHFFATSLEKNKDQLIVDKHDALLSQASSFFNQHLAQNISSIPFYMAKNRAHQRLIQAVASSLNNHATDHLPLWQAIQARANALADLLRLVKDTGEKTLSFGLYCYQGGNNHWMVKMDADFSTAEQKSMFINRALLAQQRRFFHCTLSSIQPDITAETDLNQLLSRLRHQNANNVRHIKDIVHSLFAIGELTDITTILQNAFQPSKAHQQ